MHAGTETSRAVVRAYHEAWSSGRVHDAVARLSPDLTVEVPVNSYPTRESFGAALQGFGPMVRHITLLAEFAEGDEAMLLYDLDVSGLGVLRVAEHFTLDQGRITRIRQIHDTVAVRAAGLARER